MIRVIYAASAHGARGRATFNPLVQGSTPWRPARDHAPLCRPGPRSGAATCSRRHRPAAPFYRGEDRRGESVVAGSDETVLDYGTGFLCGDVQAGDLPPGVGVDAGGDQACMSALSRPRAGG